MSLFSLFHLSSCANTNDSNAPAPITRFTYHFDGTIGRNSHTYNVQIADQQATITIEDMRHFDYGEMVDTAGVDFIQALEELCAKHNVKRYDGFDGYDRHMQDGKGFSLSIRYADGKTVYAHGMNKFPQGYREFYDDLHTLFEPYYNRMCDNALQRKKDKGVSGPLTCMLVNFIQHGEAGRDEYKVLISRTGIRKPNVEVTIRSVSGEYFPEGNHSYYTDIADDAFPWKKFEALVKKHQLVQWMDFDQKAEDPNNAEWFQIALSFEDGRISACGTAHPEHYDAFRRDFLSLLKKTVSTIKE